MNWNKNFTTIRCAIVNAIKNCFQKWNNPNEDKFFKKNIILKNEIKDCSGMFKSNFNNDKKISVKDDNHIVQNSDDEATQKPE